MAIRSIDPATGQEVASYPETSPAQVQGRVKEAETAFRAWRRADVDERAAKLSIMAEIFRAGRTDYAQLMAREMGKPISQGEAEIEKCALACEYYGLHTSDFLRREQVPTD